MKCKHCGREIVGSPRDPSDWVHVEGAQRGLHRCWTGDTGLPYGYNAEPASVPCGPTCRGSYTPKFEE